MKPKQKKQKETTGSVGEPAVLYGTMPVFHRYAISDEYALIKKAREGIRADVFYDVADAIRMSDKTLASVINLSARTISNYREQHKNLDANYSEHLLKLINLYGLGEEIFGSIEEFNLWMGRPFWHSDERPVDLITTPGGVDLVRAEVEKLAQGYAL